MPSFLARVWQKVWRPTGYVGRDLQGNRFYERFLEGSGSLRRTRRVVKYQDAGSQSLPEQASNAKTLPVQWIAWLSHTRLQPPTIQELEQDKLRQEQLQIKVARLEAEAAEERARMLSQKPEAARIAQETNATTQREHPPPVPQNDEHQPESWAPRLSRRGA